MSQEVNWDSTNPAMFREKMYPFYYAAYSHITGLYHQAALASATLADFMIGLRGARVLDLGCGHGISTQAIVNFTPIDIMAIDQSEAMIDLFRHIFFNEELETPIESDFMCEAMSRYYGTLLDAIAFQKNVFTNSIFRRHNGCLKTAVLSGLKLDPARIGAFDAVIANHSFHWIVGDLLTAKKGNQADKTDVDEAVREALLLISSILRHEGTMVFATMESFVEDDIDRKRNEDWHKNGVRSHPILARFETRLQELLAERCELDKKDAMPRPKLFSLSKMESISKTAGFSLEHVSCQESIGRGDALDAALTGGLMLLGSYKIPWEKQLRLVQQVYNELEPVISEQERRQPIRPQSTIFCLRKIK